MPIAERHAHVSLPKPVHNPTIHSSPDPRHTLPPEDQALTSPGSRVCHIPTLEGPKKPSRTLSRPSDKPRSPSLKGLFKAHFPMPVVDSCTSGIFTSSPSEEAPRNHGRRPSLRIQIPPSPPPAYDPRLTENRPRKIPTRASPLSLTASIEISMNIDPGFLDAGNPGSDVRVSPDNVNIRINALVFLVSLFLLGATVTLFYLRDLGELGTPNPAAFLVVVFSAASVAFTLVAIHRLTKRISKRQAGWPSGIGVGVPLILLACATLAFIVFLGTIEN